MSITPQEALQRTIEHREIFHDEMLAIVRRIMGVRHKSLPIEGVQFHPEAILSEHGHQMLKNFLTYGKAH